MIFKISVERAEQIRTQIRASGGWTAGDATPEEVAEIKRYWNLCSGNTSFYDAVWRMSKGLHLKDGNGTSRS